MERMVWTAMVEFSTEIHYLWLLQYRRRKSLLNNGEREWRTRSIAYDRLQRAIKHGHVCGLLLGKVSVS